MKVCVKELLYLSLNWSKKTFSYQKFTKYWVSRLRPAVESTFDNVNRKIPMSAKIFLYVLKAYMMHDDVYNHKVLWL